MLSACLSVVVSFQRLSLSDQITSFEGLVNYARIFSDARLWNAVLHTLFITALALPIELALGMLLAYHFLDDRPLKRLFVALLIIPSVISPMVVGSMWRLMFDDRYGPINQIISWFAGEHVSILWTINVAWAYPAIIITDVWQWTPFMFIVLLAALSNVDREQLDAAAIDGASRWRTFREVTLPAIRPVMMIAMLIRGLDLDPALRLGLATHPGRPRDAPPRPSRSTPISAAFRSSTRATSRRWSSCLPSSSPPALVFVLKRMAIAR